jgi:hypothetical protein
MYVVLQLNINMKFLLCFNVLLNCVFVSQLQLLVYVKVEMELVYVFYFIICFLNRFLSANNTLAYFSSNFDSFYIETG